MVKQFGIVQEQRSCIGYPAGRLLPATSDKLCHAHLLLKRSTSVVAITLVAVATCASMLAEVCIVAYLGADIQIELSAVSKHGGGCSNYCSVFLHM